MDVGCAPEHLVTLPCAARDRFELLEIGASIGEPSLREASGRALPAQLREARCAGDRRVEPRERVYGIVGERRRARMAERRDCARRIALAFTQERSDRAGDIACLEEEIAEELPEIRRSIRRAKRCDCGLGPAARVRVDLGDAPADLGMARRPLERGEVVTASAVEVVAEACVVGGA